MQHFHSLACENRNCVNSTLLAVSGKARVSCRRCLDAAAKATGDSVTMQAISWLLYKLEVKGSNASLVDTLLQTMSWAGRICCTASSQVLHFRCLARMSKSWQHGIPKFASEQQKGQSEEHEVQVVHMVLAWSLQFTSSTPGCKAAGSPCQSQLVLSRR